MTSTSDEKWRPLNCFFSRVGLRTYQHPCMREPSGWYLKHKFSGASDIFPAPHNFSPVNKMFRLMLSSGTFMMSYVLHSSHSTVFGYGGHAILYLCPCFCLFPSVTFTCFMFLLVFATMECWKQVQYGLVLRRFVLRRFTFTTLVQSDRALPTCGASLSQLKRPFST